MQPSDPNHTLQVTAINFTLTRSLSLSVVPHYEASPPTFVVGHRSALVCEPQHPTEPDIPHLIHSANGGHAYGVGSDMYMSERFHCQLLATMLHAGLASLANRMNFGRRNLAASVDDRHNTRSS